VERVEDAETVPFTAWRGPVKEPIVRPFVPETVRAVDEAKVKNPYVPDAAVVEAYGN
jgi:hypothetical protein